MHGKNIPPRLFNRLLGALVSTASSGGPAAQQTLGVSFRSNARLGIPADFFGGGELSNAGIEVAQDSLGARVYGVAGGGGEAGRLL